MKTFRTFKTTQEARDYRHQNGTGGWIFSPIDNSDSILFPPEFTPTAIVNHPTTCGKTGFLFAN